MNQDTTQAKVFVGVDIHRGAHRAIVIPATAFQGEAWKKLKPLEVTNTRTDFDHLVKAILKHCEQPSQAAIAVDHTGGHYSAPQVYYLTQRGFEILFLHAKALKQVGRDVFGTEDKTDALDARGMARWLHTRELTGENMRVTAWKPDTTPTRVVLGAQAREYLTLRRLHTRATNRLRHLFSSTFPEAESQCFDALCDVALHYPTPQHILEVNAEHPEALDFLPLRQRRKVIDLAVLTVGVPGEHLEGAITSAAWQRRNLGEQLKALLSHIKETLPQHPYTPILLSFPGMSQVGAATLIATIGEVHRFPSVKEFRKHLGVYVVTDQTGDSAPLGKMGREGSRDARRVLFQAVFSCLSPRHAPNPFREYYQRKLKRTPAQKTKKGTAVPRKPSLVATMGKYAEVLYHCLLEHEFYQYPLRKERTDEPAAEASNAQANPPPAD